VDQLSFRDFNPPQVQTDAQGVQHFGTLVQNANGSYSIVSNPRLNPNFGTLSLTQPSSTSRYNGLQTSLNSRFSKGVQTYVSYTMSHCTDLAYTYGGLGGNNGTSNWNNPYDGSTDKGALAQSSIGQRDVRMTAIQGAMIAATVANGGEQRRPYLVQQLLSSDRRPIYTAVPKTLRTPINGQVASDLQDMMISVVQNGTGKKAKISGFKVGGKTGTAQNAEGADPHGWFIGFAFNEKGEAVSAVCVMLENVSGGHASAEAARIAGLIMKAAAGRGGD